MISRIRMAIGKIIFCIHISSDIHSFLKLIWNTKQFKWSQKKEAIYVLTKEVPKKYSFRLGSQNTQIILRTFSGDIAIFYEVFRNKVYELPIPGDEQVKTIVDLGANIGLSSLFFWSKYPNASIYSVEPEESNFNLLMQNLEAGILKKNIIPIQAAIDSEDGEASIQVKDLRYNCKIIPFNKSSPTVRTISIQTLLKEFSIGMIDIMKIDIEGTEEKLFEGETGWLDHVNYLLIEFHSAAIKAFCLDVLHSRNWTIRTIKTEQENNYLFLASNDQNLPN